MPMRKNIKISAAKRGHHERHKKNLFKSKKTLTKEKQQKENIFKSKRENVSKWKRNELKKGKKRKDNVKESDKEKDLEQRMDMIAESGSESEINEDYDMEETNEYKPQIEVLDDTETMELKYRLETELDSNNKEMRELLPIKTKQGLIPRETDIIIKKNKKSEKNKKCEPEPEPESNENEDIFRSDDEANDDQDSDNDILESLDKIIKPPSVPKDIVKLSTADLLAERQETIESLKFKIGVLCSGILEKPEEKIKNLTILMHMIDEKNKEGRVNFFTIRKMSILSLMEIFKDIIPEYKVGVVDLETQKVKKITLQRVNYEKDLLGYYKRFLTKMERLTSKLKVKRFQTLKASKQDIILAELAVQCLCELLSEHPYFNYSTNVAQLLVALLNTQNENIRSNVYKCFTGIFKNDKRLDLTRHIVRHINNLIKKNQNVVHVELISCLLSLQIKNINLDAEKENEIKQKKLEQHKSRVINLSKREKKRKKKLADLERELLETKAEENKQTKNSKLVDIMKLTFTIYFRILKQNPNSKLLSVTLEGLAKFAHMINIEFFSDLIEVLYKLLQNGDLGYREQLHCVQTVFTILSGQGEVLNIDPARFYSHLYKNLLEVHAGKNHGDAESILMTVENVLIKRRKHITHLRYLAFLKRLMILSMQLLHNGSLGCLSIIKTALQLNNRLDVLLDTEQHVGSGRYDPNIEEPEFSNANCTNFFEISLMSKHYHPTVKKYINHIAAGVPLSGNGMLPSELGKLSPTELFEQFDGTAVAFNPAIPMPNRKYIPPVAKSSKHFYVDDNLRKICKRAWNSSNCTTSQNGGLNFYLNIKSLENNSEKYSNNKDDKNIKKRKLK
uniref:Nucleolar complex protein 3 homolog n=2 Tax=Culicoides sonorensis TaxID=179676 RepID=A0A336M7G6_CULSO